MVRVRSVIMREIASLICLINIREGGRLRPRDLTYVCLQPPYHISSKTSRIKNTVSGTVRLCTVVSA